jgi:serine/threonine protein kinase
MTQSENGLKCKQTRQQWIEEVCTHFEEAWKNACEQKGAPPRIDDHSRPASDLVSASKGPEKTASQERDRELLLNLALTDLEYRWRFAARTPLTDSASIDPDSRVRESSPAQQLPCRPRVEDYVGCYPILGPLSELPIDLIEEEFSVRHLFGDQPPVEEYISRFGAWHPHLGEQLAQLQHDLASSRKADELHPDLSATPATSQTSERGLQPGHLIRYLGDYELIEELGRGGMGRVYRARQISLNRPVAVKMLLSGLLADEEAVRRFHSEAENAARLDHPGIVPIFEVGEHEGLHYFSMGYVDGRSLAAMIADHPLPPLEAAQIMATVADAVAYAHSQGVIHRDLKPANILLDQGDQPRITDFGLAKRLDKDSGLTRSGAAVGTPSYMPPEQASGHSKRIDARSDVYSLGATLYAMLSGRPPFQADNPSDTCLQVLQQDPIPLRQLNPKVPRDLETICLKCLEKDPRRRYASAQEFTDELTRYLADRPIHARPIRRSERLWRWCKRNPAVAGLLASVFLLLVAGSLLLMSANISVYFALQAKAREAEAAFARVGEDVALSAANRSLAEKNFEAAKLAGEHGQWRLSLANLDEAIRIGHPDPVKVNLERIRILRVMGEHSRWAEEIRHLSKCSFADLARHQAEFLMCRAALLRFEGKEEEGLRLVESAVGGLPPAEDAYARSLLAETSPKAVRRLREALKLDFFHHAARVDLVGLLFCLGERAEARSLAEIAHGVFPDDPSFPAWLAIVAAIEGDPDEAKKWCDIGRERLAPKEAELLETLVTLLYSVGKIDLEGTMPPLNQMWDITASGAKILFKSKHLLLGGDLSSTMRASPLPLARPVKEAAQMVWGAIAPGTHLALSMKHTRQIEQLQNAAKIHPEGTIQLVLGLFLASDGRWQKSEEVCLQAARGGAILPQVRRWAYYNAAAAAAMQYKITQQKEHAERMWTHLRQFAAAGQVTPAEVMWALPVLRPGEQYDLTRDLVNAALRTRPGDTDMVCLRIENEVHFAQKLYEDAKITLGKNPKDAQAAKYIEMYLRTIVPVARRVDMQDKKAQKHAPAKADNRGSR